MTKTFAPSAHITKHAHISQKDYKTRYAASIADPDTFWAEAATRLDWVQKPTIIQNTSFTSPVSIQWYEDGVLNACYNCVDRHAAKNPNGTAFIFEGNDPANAQKISYGDLKDEVSRLANALKERGVQKGDRVIIYMPMIPQAAYAMLACARIGAVHSVVFGGFSPESLKNRILDCGAKTIITADEGYRGAKTVPLKNNVDAALAGCNNVQTVLTYKHSGGDVAWHDERDVWWHDLVDVQGLVCPCEPMGAEDPLFILYTSGSTGQPKGVLHTTGGYMVYASMTHEYVFDYQAGEVYWCTADVGWITGHSYIVYGPLANGAISVIFEGVPTYPDASRFWQIVDKHQVNIFYTAPTAIRALLAAGDEYLDSTHRKSLRILGTVGEPINFEAWDWYYNKVGHGHCPIVDTWWQTETGGHLLTPLPAFDLKAGSAMKPFFGVRPVLLDEKGKEIDGAGEGRLCFAGSWPSQMRGVYGDQERFEKTYFADYAGYYFSGDGARRDKDGDYWITGRMDDVLNVSGHRLGTAEIEDAINLHPDIAESAVVGAPHDIKGESVFAYAILKNDVTRTDEDALKAEIITTIRDKIGAIASPDTIILAPDLPKTRSGKIMRRILRKIAAGEFDALGDISTLGNPAAVDALIDLRR